MEVGKKNFHKMQTKEKCLYLKLEKLSLDREITSYQTSGVFLCANAHANGLANPAPASPPLEQAKRLVGSEVRYKTALPRTLSDDEPALSVNVPFQTLEVKR
jgi:hypothetical protein